MSMLSADQAERLAERVLAERFPDADAGFAAGSIIRGQGRALSDLDLVVLYARLPNARRQSFTVDGTPVEAFVHDSGTLRWMLKEDVAAGKPAMHTMVAEGRIVGPRRAAARRWQARARKVLAAGPPLMAPDELARYRYLITCRLEDLRDPRGPAEMTATGAWLYAVLAELILRGRGAWAATAQWIPRALKAQDPALEAAFTAAFDALFARHDPTPLTAFVEEALQPYGGLLFEGYENQMPAEARIDEG
jgi:hypothetical protein